MSDFLVNLIRRGAGLALGVRPRSFDYPFEFGQSLDPLETQVEGPTLPSAPVIVTPHATFAGAPSPPAVSDHRLPENPLRLDAASPPVVARAETPPRKSGRLVSAPSPSRLGIAATPVAAVAPETAKPRRAPAAAPDALLPAVSGSPLSPVLEERSTVKVARSSDSRTDVERRRSDPELRRRADGTEASSPAPSPSIVTAPVLSSLPPAPRASIALPPVAPPARGDAPAVQVQIGRIEIVTPPSPPVAATPPRRSPRGFGDRALSRRHLDRRWY
jgi:hypothetical protein